MNDFNITIIFQDDSKLETYQYKRNTFKKSYFAYINDFLRQFDNPRLSSRGYNYYVSTLGLEDE